MKNEKDQSRNQKAESGNENRGTGAHEKGRRRMIGEKPWMQRAVAKIADEWWAKTMPERKNVMLQIAVMMEGLEENKRIEIRIEAKAIRARFIHILKQPEKGCLSAIMLPEAPQQRWN